MHRFWVVNTVFLCHVVQKVKEESDGDRWRPFGAQYGYEHVIDKLLQSALKNAFINTDEFSIIQTVTADLVSVFLKLNVWYLH